jgi:hypothetical protein
MSGGLLIFVAAIYLYVAFEQYSRGNTGTALAFLGYAVSNFGLYQVTQQ